LRITSEPQPGHAEIINQGKADNRAQTELNKTLGLEGRCHGEFIIKHLKKYQFYNSRKSEFAIRLILNYQLDKMVTPKTSNQSIDWNKEK
jgi:hypothetical protein